MLWVSGPPGSGKTVLSSVITDDLRSSEETSIIATFHCSASEEATRSGTCLYASIISQTVAEMQIRDKTSRIPHPATGAYDRSIQFGRSQMSQADNPGHILLDLAKLTDNVTVILDGLDELDNSRQVVELFLRLSQEVTSLRVLFFCRELQVFKTVFRDQPHIRMTLSDTRYDIHTFVQDMLVDLPAEAGYVRDRICNDVCEKANGMFLWASLVVRDLVQATGIADVEERLSECPPGLEAMYGNFVANISRQLPKRRALAKSIMLWVCCTTRPLTVAELMSALSPNTSAQLPRFSQEFFRSTLTELCCPFITLSQDGEYIQTIHHTVREYLLNTPEPNDVTLGQSRSEFTIHQPDAHAEIAIKCVKYVLSNLDRNNMVLEDSFLYYAMVSWCHHAIRGPYNTMLEAEILNLLSASEKRQTWLFWMLFKDDDPFPFHKILRLQEDLRVWSGAQRQALSEDERPAIDPNWDMDILELLVTQTVSMATNIPSSDGIKISYFDRMMVVRDLARKLNRSGQLAEAKARIQEIIAQSEIETASHDPFIMSTMGILYDQEGETLVSLQTHQAVFSTGTIVDRSDPKLIWTVNELGRMYRHLNELDKSEEMHRNALDALSSRLPDDHPEVIWTLNTLASTLRKRGRPLEALELHMKAHDARKKTLGDLHPHTLWSGSDVAKCYRDEGRLEESLAWYRRTYDGRVSTLGPEHPDTLWSKNDLGLALDLLGRRIEALQVQESALQAQERVLGANHPHTQWTRDIIRKLTHL